MNLVQNKKARYDYFIETTYNCGMVLTSDVLKQIVNGHSSLVDRYAYIDNNIVKANIGVRDGVETINLLLNKSEVSFLRKKLDIKGYTLIPLDIYRAGNHKIKMTLGLCRGKKEYDKRETIKKRDWEREKARV